MLKCISQWAFKNQEKRKAEDIFLAARTAGFQGIELCIGDGGLLTPSSTKADCERLLSVADEAGLVVPSVASGLNWQYRPTSPDKKIAAYSRQILRRSLQVCGWLRARSLLVIPGVVGCDFVPGCEVVPYDVCMKKAASYVRSGLAEARKNKCCIALEYVWNKFLLSPLEFRSFIDQFDSKFVGFYMDTGNMVNTGYPEHWIRIMGRRTSAVHFKDFKRSIGTLDGFCDLLKGDVDWPAVMCTLRAVGYDGPCTAEFFNLDMRGLKKVSRAMDKILAM